MGKTGHKITVDELKKKSEEFQKDPTSGDRQADAIEVVAATIYEVGAALSERLEAIERQLTKLTSTMFIRK